MGGAESSKYDPNEEKCNPNKSPILEGVKEFKEEWCLQLKEFGKNAIPIGYYTNKYCIGACI